MSRENPTAGKPFSKPLGRALSGTRLGMTQLLRPGAGLMWCGRGPRRARPPRSGFEGVFVAGMDGSHPQGTRERKEDRLGEEEELDRVSDRSPVRTQR